VERIGDTAVRLVIAICIALLACAQASARRLEAGAGKPYATIKAALAACADYDTVLVYGGLYKEGNIVITKKIALIGVGRPVLDGQKKYEILSVKASNVTISGFRLQASGYATLNDPGAIKVYDSHHVTIEENVLEDNFFGIYLQFSKNSIIRNNAIRAYGVAEQQIGNGIHCWKSDSLQIVGNRVTGHRDGIYFEFVTNSVIWRNTSAKNLRYGLHFMFSNNDAYISNVFEENGAGVAVMFTHKVKMFNNVFRENWGDAAYGLLLKEISDSHIMGNRFVSNTTGIYMEGTNRIRVEKNTFESNGWAMKIQASCMDNEILKNDFLANTFDVSTNGSLVLNTFDGNYWDKYEGYDLNRDAVGDVPFHPLSLFSVIVEKNPPVMLLFRSLVVSLIDKSEKVMPSLTPDNFVDNAPCMRRVTR
jgi:nitrous oxidase accessory protein